MGAPSADHPVANAGSAHWETGRLEQQHEKETALPVGRGHLDHPRNKQFNRDMTEHAGLCNDEFYSMCKEKYTVVALDLFSGKWKERDEASSRAYFISRKKAFLTKLQREASRGSQLPTAVPAAVDASAPPVGQQGREDGAYSVNLLAGLDQIFGETHARGSDDDANGGVEDSTATGSDELGGGGDSTALSTQVGCCDNNAELIEKTLNALDVPEGGRVLDLTTGESSEWERS
jgi:hypothetical protein